MSRPKLLVTGLHGMMGSHFEAGFRDAWDFVPMDLGAGVDVTDARQVDAVVEQHADAEAIIHLAAFTDVSAASRQDGDEDGLCYRLNVTGTENVAMSAARRGIHIIHISTDFVFDGEKAEEYTEEDEPNPIEWYGKTKQLAEEVVWRSGAPATIVRTAFPYFPWKAAKRDIVAKLRHRLAKEETLELFDDQVITPTYGEDILAAFHLLAKLRPAGEIFHVTGSTDLSPYQLGLEVAGVFGFDPAKIAASSIVEYLAIDPRPRQKCLRMANRKYGDFAEKHGGTRPLAIGEGLRRVRDAQRG